MDIFPRELTRAILNAIYRDAVEAARHCEELGGLYAEIEAPKWWRMVDRIRNHQVDGIWVSVDMAYHRTFFCGPQRVLFFNTKSNMEDTMRLYNRAINQ